MKRLSLFLCAASVIVSLTSAALAENIVYQQTGTNTLGYLGYYSDNVATQPAQNITTYDNFSLVNDTTLGKVQWDGDFVEGATPVNGFTIDIRTNNNGAPGFLVYEQTVSGLANEVLNDVVLDVFDQYTYSASIAFNATAGTEYWLSIVANTQQRGDWAWQVSVAGDSSAYISGFIGNQQPQIPYDMAFTLFDNAADPTPPVQPTAATPEPGSLMLAGTGLLSLAGTLRRKFIRR